MRNKRNKTTGHLIVGAVGHLIMSKLCDAILWIEDHRWEIGHLIIGACVGALFVYTKIH